MPLIPNQEAQERYGGDLWDPMDISTWRFELQREEIDKLLTTAEVSLPRCRALCVIPGADSGTKSSDEL